MTRPLIVIGSLFGLLAVAMAAVSAHALNALDVSRQQMVRDAVQMQGWHALALVATGLWAARGGLLARLAGVAFVIGTVLFCGDVYALALGGLHLSGVAPTGGFLLMAGWLLLGASALRARGA